MSNFRKGTTPIDNQWQCQDSCVAGTGYQQGLGVFSLGAPTAATTLGGAPAAATTPGTTLCGAPAAATTPGSAPTVATTLGTTLCGAPTAATTPGTTLCGAPAAATTPGTTLCGAPAAATTLGGSVVPDTMGTLFGTGTPAVTGPFSTVPSSFGYRYAPASTPIVQPLVQNMQPAPDAGNIASYYDFNGHFVEVDGKQLNLEVILHDPLCPEAIKRQALDLYALQNTPAVNPYAALGEMLSAQIVQEQSKHAFVSCMGAAFTAPLAPPPPPPPQQVLNVPQSSSQMPPPSPRKVASGASAPQATLSTPAPAGAAGGASAPQATLSTPAPAGAAGTSKESQIPLDRNEIIRNWDNMTKEERKSLLKNKKPKTS
jgi:hypothetical protein